ATCQALQFSYGVYPITVQEIPANWSEFLRSWLADHGLRKGIAVVTQGPTERDPSANHRLEVLELDPVV
ncbi:MAG TPA: hypothetical protein PLJ27_14535, partial [Polyangiaceae bacterium]|nr:hypothetical protein [Polyangiaceae bacterium]